MSLKQKIKIRRLRARVVRRRPRFGARKMLSYSYLTRPIKRGPLPDKVRVLYYLRYSREAHRNGGGFIPVRYISFTGGITEIGSYESFRFISSPSPTFEYTEEALAAETYEEDDES
jgi:hypothetical protein